MGGGAGEKASVGAAGLQVGNQLLLKQVPEPGEN